MNKIVIIFSLIICFSCLPKGGSENVIVPDSYDIQIEWGFYNEDNLMSNFYYNSSDYTASFYNSILNDSITEIKNYNINKETADSLYKLVFKNSKQFDIADTSISLKDNKYSFSIKLYQNGKSVKNTYHMLPNYSINSEIEQIIKIIRHVTKNSSKFN